MSGSEQNKKTIISLLYVENDPALRAVFSKVIQRLFPHIELFIAENGKIGFDLYKAHNRHIVVTDINMPIMDGIQMTRLIKGINSEVTIVAISGNICDDYRLDAFSAGIDHYMNKPVMLQKFCMVIEDSVNKTTHRF